jgi:hypothetical protein
LGFSEKIASQEIRANQASIFYGDCAIQTGIPRLHCSAMQSGAEIGH